MADFTLADPDADRILFWDDGAGAPAWLSPGSGIEISGTTLQLPTTIPDSHIAESGVTQHEAALSIGGAQVDSGTLPDARIQESGVTQHEAALTILETQITDGALLARLADGEDVTGDWQFSGLNIYTPQAQGTVDGTDDDVQIQAAIDAAEAAGGGIVYLPPGTYTVGTSITVGDNVWLLGAGRDQVVIQADPALAGPVLRNDDLTNGNTGFRLSGFTADGLGDSRTGTPGANPEDKFHIIFLENCVDWKAENIKVDRTWNVGFQVRGTANDHTKSRRFVVRDVWATRCSDTGVAFDFCDDFHFGDIISYKNGGLTDTEALQFALGVWVNHCDNWSGHGVVTRDNGTNGTDTAADGIRIVSCEGWEIGNWVARGNDRHGLYVTGVGGQETSDDCLGGVVGVGWARGNGSVGVRVAGNPGTYVVQDIIIAGVGCTGNTSHDFAVFNADFIKFVGCHSKNAGSHGFVNEGGQSVRFLDCEARNPTNDGFHIVNSSTPRSWSETFILDCFSSSSGQDGIDVADGSGTVHIYGGDHDSLARNAGSATYRVRMAGNLEHDFYSAAFWGYANINAGGTNLHASPAVDNLANRNVAKVKAPFAGKARNLQFDMVTAPGSGETATAVFMVNTTETAVSASLTGTETTTENTSSEASFSRGDFLVFRFKPSNNGGYAGAHAKASVELIAEVD